MQHALVHDGSYGSMEGWRSAPFTLKALPIASLGVMGLYYGAVFGKGFKLKRMRAPSLSLSAVGTRQAIYWLGVLGLLYSLKRLRDAGAMPFGSPGYAGPSRKLSRLQKRLARLQRKLAKKQSRGRAKAVARIQRKIDKVQAKINALAAEAAQQGIPGYQPAMMPSMDPLAQVQADPALDASYDVSPSAGGGIPSWALPAALGGGLLLVVIAVMSGGRE